MIRCPKCKAIPLKAKKDGDLSYHHCSNCRGVLFNNAYVDKIVDSAVDKLVAPKEAKYSQRDCCFCKDQTMKEFYYPQTFVTIDMCGHCRTMWLDAGELEEIKLVRGHLGSKGKLETYVNENICI